MNTYVLIFFLITIYLMVNRKSITYMVKSLFILSCNYIYKACTMFISYIFKNYCNIILNSQKGTDVALGALG